MEFNLEKCLLSLAEKRPVFHSEADFQFSLAWEIQQQYQEAEIRLECPFAFETDDNRYIDIVVCYNDEVIPIELKYKTKEVHILWRDELYDLKKHMGQSKVRYDCLKDIQRIENFSTNNDSSHYKFLKGYIIWLTNDKSYWESECATRKCQEFSIKEGAIKSGEMNWCENPALGTIKGRKEAINLTGEYKIEWKRYKNLEDGCTRNCDFRYVILEIKKY